MPTGRRRPDGRTPDPYVLLQVDRNASAEQVTRAYHQRARELHPDIAPEDTEAAHRFAQLADAYRELSDPTRRAAHDASGGADIVTTGLDLPPEPPARMKLPVEDSPAPIYLAGTKQPPQQRPRGPLAAGPVRVEPLSPRDDGQPPR
jgi:curved DNA-binding protein CbpA